MAINVVVPFLIPLENSLSGNSTRLLSSPANSNVVFEETNYCAFLYEDAPQSTYIIRVTANHKTGASLRYSINEGNQDGLFSIDQNSGKIYLRAPFDRETTAKHELVVTGSNGDDVARCVVRIIVGDTNDNPPSFDTNHMHFTVIEEDDRKLPVNLGKITASDVDIIDQGHLIYELSGDGVDVDNPENAYFEYDSTNGYLYQKRSLDRDYPDGKPVWILKLKVEDGNVDFVGKKYVKALESKSLKLANHKLSSRQRRFQSNKFNNTSWKELTEPEFQEEPERILSFSIGCSKCRRKQNWRSSRWKRKPSIHEWHFLRTPSPIIHASSNANIGKRFHSKQFSSDWNTDGVHVKSTEKRKTNKHNHSRKERALDASFDAYNITDYKNCIQLSQFSANTRELYLAQVRYAVPNLNAHQSLTYPVHSDEITIEITVKDINDNPPKFQNSTFFADVQENGPIDLPVTSIVATDADEAGTNAIVTYSIEKNVVDELTGEPLFSINSLTGELRTAVCCLDRETTPEYSLQIVASDGGGLKGTATVIVRLSDLNDNPPRLSRREWDIWVQETAHNSSSSLFELTLNDPDTSNYFLFRIIPGSGNGWQNFGIRTKDQTGEVFAKSILDYEDPAQRNGFKFLVEVTDRGPGGFDDRRHIDSAWVSLRLVDANDNAPIFLRPQLDISIKEDIRVGTVLGNMAATDPDSKNNGEIEYKISGNWNQVEIDDKGSLRVREPLDREGPAGSNITLTIIAKDKGTPPLSSTAFVRLHLQDVNDCPPILQAPLVHHIQENSLPQLIGILTATDPDVWKLGHGPPFKITMDKSNTKDVLHNFDIKFDTDIDNGRGGAELWSKVQLDREKSREVVIYIHLEDAGGITSTQNIVVVIDDVNDNPMKSGNKTVSLWKTKGSVSKAPLGRVFVNDLDDWDTKDKYFYWIGSRNSMFYLNETTGALFASSEIREGRYILHFGVDDAFWNQRNVSATVQVLVNMIPSDAVAQAVPLTILPGNRSSIANTRENGVAFLPDVISGILRDSVDNVIIVSVYQNHLTETSVNKETSAEYMTIVWIAGQIGTAYMDSIKFRGLIDLHLPEIRLATNQHILTGDVSSFEDNKYKPNHINSKEMDGSSDTIQDGSEKSMAVSSLASKSLPFHVVDGNQTSLVTPRLIPLNKCSRSIHFAKRNFYLQSCTPNPCFNGGRCIPYPDGTRCICPGHTVGPNCQVASRTFAPKSWLWLDPLLLCLPIKISFHFSTNDLNGFMMYQGPLSRVPTSWVEKELSFAVDLNHGRARLILSSQLENLELEVTSDKLNNGKEHRIDIEITEKKVSIMVDLCSFNEVKGKKCFLETSWAKQSDLSFSQSPFQIGGAYISQPFDTLLHGIRVPSQYFRGCISEVFVNDELVDLGEPKFQSGTIQGCDNAHRICILNSDTRCANIHSKESGTKFQSVSLGSNSAVSMMMTFAPDPFSLPISVIMKTIRFNGPVLEISDIQKTTSLYLEIRNGVLCLALRNKKNLNTEVATSIIQLTTSSDVSPIYHLTEDHVIQESLSLDKQTENNSKELKPFHWTISEVCLAKTNISDGRVNIIRCMLRGNTLLLETKSDISYTKNFSLINSANRTKYGFFKDKIKLLHIGAASSIQKPVANSDVDMCLQSLRVSGRELAVIESGNSSQWSYVTESHGVIPDCVSSFGTCDFSCPANVTCVRDWLGNRCECPAHTKWTQNECRPFNECLYRPCLNKGKCKLTAQSYTCLCEIGFRGTNCQEQIISPPMNTQLLLLIIMFCSIFVTILVLILCVCYIVRKRKRRTNKSKKDKCRYPQDIKDENDDNISVKESSTICRQQTIATITHNEKVSHFFSKDASGLSSELSTVIASDDLRNYAYEGNTSSEGSIQSVISDLRKEVADCVVPRTNPFQEVMDLLKNIPDAKLRIDATNIRTRQTSNDGQIENIVSSISKSVESEETAVPPSYFSNPEHFINKIENCSKSQQKTQVSLHV